METRPELGANRTGVQRSPHDTKEMLQGSPAPGVQPGHGDPSGLSAMRSAYIRDADPVGTVPPPGTAKGMVKSGLQMLTGTRAQVLLDKLGERLAFERSGTRLYDALLVKCEAAPAGALGPVDIARLRHFRDEELRHFELVMDAIQSLGADPTAQTPCADVTGVEGLGLIQTITDPRTSVAQCLGAMLIAELTDQAAWDVLAQLAREVGQEDLAAQFDGALIAETEHTETIKTWTARMTIDMAKLGGQI